MSHAICRQKESTLRTVLEGSGCFDARRLGLGVGTEALGELDRNGSLSPEEVLELVRLRLSSLATRIDVALLQRRTYDFMGQ